MAIVKTIKKKLFGKSDKEKLPIFEGYEELNYSTTKSPKTTNETVGALPEGTGLELNQN